MSRCLALLALLLVSACTAPVTAVSGPSDHSRPSAAAEPVTFAVVGDSLTAGNSSIVDGGAPGAGSWVPAAEQTPLDLAGGWAVPGSTTAQMRAAVTPVRADVLVIMAGTNDLTAGLSASETVANVEAIVDEVGVEQVLVVAVPPKDDQPEQAQRLDLALSEAATQRQWTFIDPWSTVSDGGRYLPGASQDGVHPVQTVADEVGRAIGAAVLRVADTG